MNAKLKKPVSLLLLLCVLLAACSGQKEPISTNRNKGDSGTVASTESTGQADGPSEAVSEEPEEEEVVSRIDYFDKEGERKYFEKYAYYDNGLLCSKTLYKIDREYGEYTYPQYTFLYLYDENMEPAETLLDSYSVGITEHPSGEVSLGYEYDENGESVEVTIYPETESIEQEKFGVDPAKTELVYGGEEIISTDQSMEKWATSYLREAFNDEVATDATQCKLIYVNDDDIPELWIDYTYGYAGAKAFTAGMGTTDSFYVSHGYISWKERENLILAGSGHMDIYSTYVYRIENGRFEVVTGGPWGAADNSNIQLDAEGKPIYEYHLDKKLVTEEEFLNEINSVFDENDASDPNTSVYSYVQCKKLLQQILLFNGEEAPDDQSETDRFINNLKDLYGVASSMEFETMTGGEWNDFPDDVFGFINAITIDLDLDEKEEIVVLRSEPDRGFVVEVYTATGHGYEQTVSEWIAAFSGESGKTIALFNSHEIGGYGVVVDWESSGTYTRAIEIGADIYKLTTDAVTLVDRLEWNNVVGIPGDEQAVEDGMRNLGVPRAENAAAYDDNSNHNNYRILCRVIHRVEDAEDYNNLRGFLRIETE